MMTEAREDPAAAGERASAGSGGAWAAASEEAAAAAANAPFSSARCLASVATLAATSSEGGS
jgi:hypothetical protein